MLRIPVTMIEMFRQYIDEDKGYNFGNEYILVTEDKLIDSIQKKRDSHPKADLGTAFHDIIEKPQRAFERYRKEFGKLQDFMAENGVIFPFKTINSAIAVIDYDFPFEYKKTVPYSIEGKEIELVAKVDQWQGLRVNEHKTKWTEIKFDSVPNDDGTLNKTCFEKFSWDDYYKSSQWEYYLQIFNAKAVLYKVFEFAIDKTNYDQIELINIHQFPFEPYDGMQQYTDNLLSEFLYYIHFRGLEEYFKPKEK